MSCSQTAICNDYPTIAPEWHSHTEFGRNLDQWYKLHTDDVVSSTDSCNDDNEAYKLQDINDPSFVQIQYTSAILEQW